MRVVCFDLDDTLFKEIDYVQSAYREIAEFVGHPEMFSQMLDWRVKGENVFVLLNKQLGLETPIPQYLSLYRNHKPSLVLDTDTVSMLEIMHSKGIVLGIISDGRSRGQRNKLEALNLGRFIKNENIIISEEFGTEKPSEKNFRYFMDYYPGASFWYVADNPQKDFIAPNALGWTTVMLKDDGRNIHRQESLPVPLCAQIEMSSIGELLNWI